jgi:hypothetical protein
VRVRWLDVEQDAVPVHAFDDASFAGAPDYHATSLPGYREEHLAAHDLDPELSLVAELGGQISGVLLARRRTEAGAGFVDILAVHPTTKATGSGRLSWPTRSVCSAPRASKKRSSGWRRASRGP